MRRQRPNSRIRRLTRAATQQQFRPLERKLAGERRASHRRSREEGSWWNDYLKTVAQGRSDVGQAYQQAAAQQAAQIAAAGQASTAQTQGLQAEEAQSAAARGASTSGTAAATEAAAAAQRGLLAAQMGGKTAREGATQYSYLTDKMGIGKGQSIAARNEEGRRERSIRQEQRGLARERGAYATTKRGELQSEAAERREAARKGALEAASLRLQQREAGQAALEGAQKRREGRRQQEIENRQEQEKIGIARKEARGGMTRSERNAKREGNQNAITTARRIVKLATKPIRSPADWAAVEQGVAEEAEVSAAEARRAVAQLRKQAEAKRTRHRQVEAKRRKSVIGTVLHPGTVTK